MSYDELYEICHSAIVKRVKHEDFNIGDIDEHADIESEELGDSPTFVVAFSTVGTFKVWSGRGATAAAEEWQGS